MTNIYHGYYGNYQENNKPNKEFYYMLLDEHMQALVDKNVGRFKKECAKIYSDIRKENRDSLRQVKKDITLILKQLDNLEKKIDPSKVRSKTRFHAKPIDVE